jgi:hypothetical protein
MELSPTTIRVPIKITVFIKTGEWRRIGHPFVEVANFLGGSMMRCLDVLLAAQFNFPQLFFVVLLSRLKFFINWSMHCSRAFGFYSGYPRCTPGATGDLFI